MDVREDREHHDRDQADHGGQDVLERVDAVQRFVEDQGERRDIHDAERRAEVTAIDRPDEGHGLQRDVPAPRRQRPRMADQTAQPLLERERRGRTQHQERHDQLERLRRREQQQRASEDAAGEAGRHDRPQSPALPGEIRATADDAGDVAGEDGDGVRDVGVHGREPDRDQRRERDQRAAASDRVDYAGRDARGDEQEDVRKIHGPVESTGRRWRGYDGRATDESAGRSRRRPGGRRRGTSGLRRAGWLLTATRGDPRESATENRPPAPTCR